MTKSAFALSALLIAMGAASTANAETQTLSLGYSHASVDGFSDINGVTAKYHYQTENPLGIIGSFTYMGGDENRNYGAGDIGKEKLKYYSLLAGPSYRFNELFSVYGLVGVARGKVDWHYRNVSDGYYEAGSESKTDFAYGVGVQFVPAANWTIDAGYEGTKLDQVKVNGFNIGVGYRF